MTQRIMPNFSQSTHSHHIEAARIIHNNIYLVNCVRIYFTSEKTMVLGYPKVFDESIS